MAHPTTQEEGMAKTATAQGGVEALIEDFLNDPANKEMLEEAKRRADEAQRQIFGSNGAVQLRDLRRRVRQTCNLVSTNGPVHEHPGASWSAHMDSRTIFWRPTLPFPPFSNLTENEVLYLCAHEASHLNYSGSYDPDPQLKDDNDRARFHRFVNAVEDIRCDRLSGTEFPGFKPLQVNLDKKVHGELVKMSPEEWSLVDQVGLSYVFMDNGLAPIGSDDGKRIALETWGEITRVANVGSTAEVATAILPLYLKLRDADPQGDQPGGQGQGTGSIGSGDGDPLGMGQDQPGDPSRSKGGTYGPMDGGEVLDGMANDAGDTAKGKLQGAARDDKRAQKEGESAAQTLGGETDVTSAKEQAAKWLKDEAQRLRDSGHTEAEIKAILENTESSREAGRGQGGQRSSDAAGETSWQQERDRMRGEINSLYSKLRAVLRSNAMDTYESGKRRGMLDSRRAYRASAGNPRIFRKRTTVGDLDYSFGIVIDISGSMGGQMKDAFATVVLISEALEKAGLGLFVLPWDDGPAHLKPLSEPLSRHRGRLGSYLRSARGGTYEAPALVIAQEEFAKVRSGHRMLFVISDGHTNNPQESKQLAKELQDSGVRVVSIGINFDPAAHYNTKLKVGSAGELAHVLPRFINETVKRGHHA